MGSTRPLPPRAQLARRPRRRLTVALRRQPILFWALALTAAAASYWTVDTALAGVRQGAAAYGELETVAVAQRALAAGDAIEPGDVQLASLPAALVPEGALRAVPDGRRLRADVAAGEAIVTNRLAPEGALGVAAALAPGERALAVPTDAHRAPLLVGQRVDVLATVDPTLAAGRNPTTVVAESARVLDVEEEGITVAVSAAEADRVATALATTVVTVAVTPD